MAGRDCIRGSLLGGVPAAAVWLFADGASGNSVLEVVVKFMEVDG